MPLCSPRLSSPSLRLLLLLPLALVRPAAGCGAAALPAEGSSPLQPAEAGATAHPPPGRVLAESPALRLLLLTPDLYREPGDRFSVRLRVENRGAHELDLDLASPTLVGPTHFGPLTAPQRQLVDERRLPDEALDDVARERLRRARAEGTLTRLPAGESLELYAPFHGTEAVMFMGFATPWVFVGLDGYLDAIGPGDELTRLSLAWNDTRTHLDTDIVHRMPVVLEERACRRERRVVPRGGSAEWPLVVCAPARR